MMKVRITCALVSFSFVFTAAVPSRPYNSSFDDLPTGSHRPTANLNGAAGAAAFKGLPLRFELNKGQAPQPARFITRAEHCSLLLSDTGPLLTVRDERPMPALDFTSSHPIGIGSGKASGEVRMSLAGSNPAATATGIDELPGKVNYFIGNDPSNWITGVSTYAKVVYERVYPGIDLVFYGQEGELEYDFLIAPRTDPGIIAIALNGAGRPAITPDGDLVVQTAEGTLRHRRPVAFQVIDGRRCEVAAAYSRTASTTRHAEDDAVITIEVGAYDRSYPLTIDPVLTYSTYVGGSGGDFGTSIAVDASGSTYLGGYSSSKDLPSTLAFQEKAAGGFDAFVAKLDPTGAQLLFCTYLGGSGTDRCTGLALDGAGNIVLTGITASGNFPRARPVQAELGGSYDAWVAKLTADGSALIYSTYLGGSDSDQGTAITADGSGKVYVTGITLSDNFPTANPLQDSRQGRYDLFLSGYDALGTALTFSTYWGGSDDDLATSIAADAAGHVYIAGHSRSRDFSTAAPFQPTAGGGTDAILMKFDVQNRIAVYATYLGGSLDDAGRGLALDANGNAYVVGETYSTNFPIRDALQPTLLGRSDVFISKLSAAGNSLIYSTYFGGRSTENSLGGGAGIALDRNGQAYITGSTSSKPFPLLNPVQAAFGGGTTDAFVAALSADGRTVIYSSYLGGGGNENEMGGGAAIAVDATGKIYVIGSTTSDNFPVQNAYQSLKRGPISLFVTKLTL